MFKINKLILFLIIGSSMNNIMSNCIPGNGCITSIEKCDQSCKICNGTQNHENKVIMQAVDHAKDLFISILIKDGIYPESKEELVKQIRALVDSFKNKEKK